MGFRSDVFAARHRHFGFNYKLGLGTGRQRCQSRREETHVKYMKDHSEFRPPGSNYISVGIRVGKARDSTSLAYLADVSLDLRHSPASGEIVSNSGTMYIPITSLTSSAVQSP